MSSMQASIRSTTFNETFNLLNELVQKPSKWVSLYPCNLNIFLLWANSWEVFNPLHNVWTIHRECCLCLLIQYVGEFEILLLASSSIGFYFILLSFLPLIPYNENKGIWCVMSLPNYCNHIIVKLLNASNGYD